MGKNINKIINYNVFNLMKYANKLKTERSNIKQNV